MKIIILSMMLVSFWGNHPQEQETCSLTQQEIKTLEKQVKAVPDSVRSKFDATFDQWLNNWKNNPKTKISSSTYDARKLEEYPKLLSMGTQIIPLVIEKLSDPKNFVGLVLYDSLQNDENYKTNDMGTGGGEQKRALKTVKQWIKSVN